MTAPTPKSSRAGEQIAAARSQFECFRLYDITEETKAAESCRESVLACVDELEKTLFEQAERRSTEPLTQLFMDDLNDFMMLAVGEAKELVGEAVVDRLGRRYGAVVEWQRALHLDRERVELANLLREGDG